MFELLDDFKHLAIDMKTTVTALIVESMRRYLKRNEKAHTILSILWSTAPHIWFIILPICLISFIACAETEPSLLLVMSIG